MKLTGYPAEEARHWDRELKVMLIREHDAELYR